jgi:hypothetical protein
VARSIAVTELHAQAQVHAAVALASAGQFQHAETVARSISIPDSQALALAHVAERLAMRGDIPAARRMAAVTCAAGRWMTAARPVLLVDPPALVPLACQLNGSRSEQP